MGSQLVGLNTLKISELRSSQFRQSGVLSSRLVVELVETHQRVTPAVGPLVPESETPKTVH